MRDDDALSRQELLDRVNELQSLLNALRAEKKSQEIVNFPWVGNLGTWHFYVKTNRVLCNTAKTRALGFKDEDVPERLGHEFFTQRLHPDDYERVMDNMRRHLEGKSPAYESSYRIQTTEGGWIWFYDRGKVAQRDETGAPELVTGIVFDITEQKHMEELLERQNQRLLEMSNTDFLTNLYNRRALFEKLDYEISRSARNKQAVSVLLLDIDHFKQINDTHGHLTGDQVLSGVAGVIKKSVRMTDIVGRYGGEEFLVVFPECSLNNGLTIAEKIRQNIQTSEFVPGLRVTVSGGLVEFKNETIDELVERADIYLYQAKRGGRNRIVTP